MSSEPREIMGTEASAPTSTLIVSGTVPMDVEKASGSGVKSEVQAAEAKMEDDGKGAGKAEVVEVEKKDVRKQIASRSEMWNHFEKVKIDGVLQKGKCNYCKIDINAHPVINGSKELAGLDSRSRTV